MSRSVKNDAAGMCALCQSFGGIYYPHMSEDLPPGQRERADFPRFGLTRFASRFPLYPKSRDLKLSGDAVSTFVLSDPLGDLTRHEQVSDFHCVTTWTHRALRWGGVRFADFYHLRIAHTFTSNQSPACVVLCGQDGYKSSLPLSDLLQPDVLLADTLNGAPLSLEHGAPLRLVAPAHYGYKAVKHLSRIEFWRANPILRRAAFAFMDHPRARVAHEERGRWIPGVLLRLAYRPLVEITAAKFEKAVAEYKRTHISDA